MGYHSEPKTPEEIREIFREALAAKIARDEFSVEESGIAPALRHALKSVPGIASAWLYGSFAKNEADAASDIDVLIVGQPDQTELAAEMRKAEKALRREINYTVLTLRELNRRLARRDAFLADVWNGKRIELITADKELLSPRD